MKKLGLPVFFGFIVIIVLLLILFMPITSQKPTPTENVPSPESLVSFPDNESKNKFLESNGLTESDLQPSDSLENTYIVPVPNDKLKGDGATVAPRRQYKALLTPDDPIYPQWYTNNISAPTAWDTSTGSSSVEVAVIDTGFALSHEDLVGRWYINSGEYGAGKDTNGVDDDGNGKIDDWRGWDFVCNNNSPQAGDSDCDSDPTNSSASHGTVTSGLIGATGNNSTGVASINWQSTILPLQVLGDDGYGYTDDVAAAVNYAVAQGAQVISMSLGSASADPTLETSINNAVSAGVVVLAAAGNCGDPNTYIINGCTYVGQMSYPGKYSNVIAVGATDQNDNRATFSSYGPELDIVAPGSGTIRAPTWSQSDQTGAYTSAAYGTSIATPIAAGSAALYRGVATGETVNEVTQVLENSANQVSGMGGESFTDYYGHGRLDVHGIVRLATIVHPDGTLIIDQSSGKVYLIENGQKRYISSPSIFLSYYDDVLSQSKPATPGDLALTDGVDIPLRSGTVIKGSGLELYAVQDISGTLYKEYIPSPAVHNDLGFTESERVQVSDSYLASLPDGTQLSSTTQHPNGSLVIAPDGITVYLIDNNQKRHVSNPWVLISLNKGKHFTKTANSADMNLTTGTDVDFEEGALIKGSAPQIYVTNDLAGVIEKRNVATPFIYQLLGYEDNAWINVPDADLPSQTGTLIE